METSLRLTASPFELAVRALGDRKAVATKLRRIASTAALYVQPREIPDRLERLREAGYVDRTPTRAQLWFGGLDMVRYVIAPAARDYYQAKGISFSFHSLLRLLDDPVSMIDPTGLLSQRDTIVGHVMQVVHLNPVYDLQLLEAFPDGLAELEAQVREIIAGTHPRSNTIAAIVEDPGYHARLLDYVVRFRVDRDALPPVRASSLRTDPTFAEAEQLFGTLPGFLSYCVELPASPFALALRLVRRPPFRAPTRPA